MRPADPPDQALVLEEVVGARATRHEDDLGVGKVLEGGLSLDAEHAVVGADDPRLVGQPGDTRARQA